MVPWRLCGSGKGEREEMKQEQLFSRCSKCEQEIPYNNYSTTHVVDLHRCTWCGPCSLYYELSNKVHRTQFAKFIDRMNASGFMKSGEHPVDTALRLIYDLAYYKAKKERL